MSNILVMGRRGLGKSTLAEFVAVAMNKNVAAFDPGNQFQDLRVRTSELDDVRKEFERDWTAENPLSLAYIPPVGPDPTADEIEPYWNRFAATIWAYMGQHDGGASFVLIVDESSELQSPSYVNPWLNRIIRRAPRKERGDANPVDTVQTFHRPQDLNGIIGSQVDTYYIFNMVKQRDLKVIRDEWGEDIAAAVANLRTPRSEPPGRDVLMLNAETGEWSVIKDESFWYVDIRAPRKESKASIFKAHRLDEMYA